MNIEHGEKLFEFRSKQDWINKAQRIWRFHEVRAEHTVCVDQLGRICGWGKHFADAERDNAYPIEVFLLRQDMPPANPAYQGDLDALRAFAQAVMEAWPTGGLDGGDLQVLAETHGLLKPETRHEPCGEGCACAEHAGDLEFKRGVTCFRKTSLLLGEEGQNG